jgi:hypothetical protein
VKESIDKDDCDFGKTNNHNMPSGEKGWLLQKLIN